MQKESTKVRSAADAAGEKVITLSNMNPQLRKMEYAVRGPLVIRATQIEKELSQVGYKFTFGLTWGYGI